MRLHSPFRAALSQRSRLILSSLILGFSLANVKAVAPGNVVLSGSIKPVEAAPAAGQPNPQRPFVSRQTLTAAETEAPLVFELSLKMRNFADLQARVSRGELISAQEMAAKYEPLAADYQTVKNWLVGQGFTIERTDSHYVNIFARGKISRIAQALQVSFARVTSDGNEYTSAVTAPSVPGNVAALLVGINGLQPHMRAHKHLIKQGVQPNASGGSGSYIPSQIANAYGATGLYASNVTGSGQTIAIVIDTFPSTTDLQLFWTNCSVNQSINNIAFVQAVSGTLPSASGEETLDTEWASSMAPNVHVRVYAATDLANADLDQAYQQVLDDVINHPEYGIHQMSMSYGEGETYYSTQGQTGVPAQITTDDQLFAQLAAKGVTLFASSGDGASTPGPNGSGDKSGPTQVETPASDPNVMGVGGTTLKLDSNNNVTSETVWNNSTGGSGGGTSIFFNRPSWQTGTGVPAGTMREVPDVAAAADPNFGAIYYFGGVKAVIGGTSWASPTWAGLCALMNQARANAGLNPLGVLGPSIYPLLGTASYSTNIRDIVSGSNGYNAQVGYDLATGVGAPLALALTHTTLGSSALIGILAPSAMDSIMPGQTATFSVAVTGSSATYRWQRKPVGSTTWSDLTDGGAYSGSGSATLTVANATTAMSGDQFQCVITLAGNVVITSTPAVLVAEAPMTVSTLAGSTGVTGLQNGTGTGAEFYYPSGISLDSSGNLYIADFSNNQIRKVTPGGVVSTPYGSVSGASGNTNSSGNNARFNTPNGVATDGSGNIFVADSGNNLIRKITTAGVVSSYGTGGQFNVPEGVAVDSSGNVYVADTDNDTIRKITTSGAVSTIGGQKGIAGYADGASAQSLFTLPSGVAVDRSSNVYVADFGNSVIRKITPAGVVSTLAGQATVSGYLDGPGGSALFNGPTGLVVDSSNNIYVTDCLIPPQGSNAAGNDLIRKVTSAGVVSTLAGSAGNAGYANGTGTAAQFYSVQALALNASTGAFYFADTYNQLIRSGIQETTISVATTANASFAPVPGQFTVYRDGNTSASVTVNYTVSGTAVPGTDYSALSGSVTIPAGSGSANITVNPIASSATTTQPTVILTLASSSAYALGAPVSATMTILQSTSYQNWAASEFGANANDPSIAGSTADPNHNGVPNLLEYAFNSDPLQTGTEPLPTLTTAPDSNGLACLAITYTQLNTDPNLTYTVQVTSDPSGVYDQWHSGASYTTVVSQVGSGDITRVTVRDNVPIAQAVKRFIRVQVSSP
jgi:kumamolisin